MKPEEIFEKYQKDPDYILSPEEIRGLGRDGFRKLMELLIETPEFRKGVVDYYVALEDYAHAFDQPMPKAPGV
jgi:hypothetical protein